MSSGPCNRQLLPSFYYLGQLMSCLSHIQLLDGENILIIADDGENMKVYLSRVTTISQAVQQDPKKKLNRTRLPANAVITYDEAKRLLVIASVPDEQVCVIVSVLEFEEHVALKVFLDVLVFDPSTMSLASRGSRINLTRWFEPAPRFQTGCFVSGQEEIFLLEETGRGRIFSLITEQFRFAFKNMLIPY
jgi:hypothetical protein